MNHTLVLEEIRKERQKQINIWGNESDDKQVNNEIIQGAAAYLLNSPNIWPATEFWRSSGGFKKHDRRSQLIRAATMIVAEIERMDRAQGAQS